MAVLFGSVGASTGAGAADGTKSLTTAHSARGVGVVAKCRGRATTRPSFVVFACGDGNFYAKRITWDSWGGSRATGRGTAHVNSCDPNCAEGKFETFPVRISVSRVRSCHGGRRYTRATTSFSRSDRPSGPRRFSWPLSCGAA
jgi:hypothetical protein